MYFFIISLRRRLAMKREENKIFIIFSDALLRFRREFFHKHIYILIRRTFYIFFSNISKFALMETFLLNTATKISQGNIKLHKNMHKWRYVCYLWKNESVARWIFRIWYLKAHDVEEENRHNFCDGRAWCRMPRTEQKKISQR